MVQNLGRTTEKDDNDSDVFHCYKVINTTTKRNVT